MDKDRKIVYPIGVGIVGLGTVGGGVYKILTKHPIQGIRLAGVYNRSPGKYSSLGIKPALRFPSLDALLSCDEVDVVVETVGGTDAAKEIVENALRMGKHVVTANKDLIASYGETLRDIAVENGVRLEFSASVCGSIPVFSNIKRYHSVDEILSIYGIFNGTTNFILSLMSDRGLDLEESLKIAQSRGYAEAIPKKDINGIDAAYKLAIISWIAFGYLPSLNEFSIEGIENITKTDVRMLQALGYEIKLISYVKKDKKRIGLFVSPMGIRKGELLANIKSEDNAVVIERQHTNKGILLGKGAGRYPTAAAVVSDIMNIANEEYVLKNNPDPCDGVSGTEFSFPYYIRLTVKDVNSMSINMAFEDEGISIKDIKRENISRDLNSLVIKTAFTTKSRVRNILNKLRKYDWFVELNNMIPIFEFPAFERKKPIIVQKFGGTSVGTVERIKDVAKKIVDTKRKGNDVVVVVSAMGRTTDDLMNLAYEIANKPDSRELDVLLSTGEQISMALLSMAIQDKGEKAVSFTGSQVRIVTDRFHTMAKLIDIDDSRIVEALKEEKIPIIAGFQGITLEGEITTLGRGGSDITAVALAYVLGASRCEIYTDVKGVMTADPKIVPNAAVIDELSYDEMIEMSYHGAQVLQARAIEFARRYGVEVAVKSSFFDSKGTKIKEGSKMEEPIIRAVVYDTDIMKIVVEDVPDRPGIAAILFRRLAEVNATVDMIVQSMHHGGKNDIAFTIKKNAHEGLREAMEKFKKEVGAKNVVYEEDVAKISLVGSNIVQEPKVAMGMFESLADAGINIDMISSTGSKISCIVNREEVEKGVRVMHDHFKLGER